MPDAPFPGAASLSFQYGKFVNMANGKEEYVQFGFVILPCLVERFLCVPLESLQEGVQGEHQDVVDILHLKTQTRIRTVIKKYNSSIFQDG